MHPENMCVQEYSWLLHCQVVTLSKKGLYQYEVRTPGLLYTRLCISNN
jgi:hypothetical protein